MSDDMGITLGSGELDGDAIEVRRYVFGFRHAVALSTAAILSLVAASAALSLVHLGNESLWRDAGSIAFVDERPPQQLIAEEFSEPAGEAARSLWGRVNTHPNELLSAAKRSFSRAWRIRNERVLTEAFAELNQSDPRQVREFLAAHEDNLLARELGYIAAVQRAVAERRLYRSENIVACGKCWCWRERPTLATDTTATQ